MAYSVETIGAAWEKARGTTELSVDLWRKDECGAWIKRDHFGEQSPFGWKLVNVSLGGPDTIENLRPFHHANAYDRANQRAQCRVVADQSAIPVTGHIRNPRNRERT
jgi:hypothetical protein